MIEVIIRPRQAGKTYEVIKKAAENNSYIICPDKNQVQLIAEMARKMEVVIPFPLTWQEFMHQQYYGKHIDNFMIDNLDMCIQSMTHVPIKAVTMNGVLKQLNDYRLTDSTFAQEYLCDWPKPEPKEPPHE